MTKSAIATLILSALVACCGQSSNGPTSPAEPGVLFSDDFESGTLKAWQDGMDPSRHRIVSDATQAQSGSRYLAVTYPAGRDGGWLTRFLKPAGDSLYVSYYVRFPENWQGQTKLVSLYGSRTDDRWSAFGKAGTCPTGTDFFATTLVTAPEGNPGPARFYTYYPGMAREPDGVTCWGRYGNGAGSEQGVQSADYASSLTMSRGVWHHIEFWVEINTPGRADGRQGFWIDGKPKGSWSGLAFRDSEILRLNAVQLSFSATGGVPQTQELDVDNLVVRTTRP